MPFLTGLTMNYVQCLNDFNNPLQLSHTVNRILGDKRVEAIESVQVDKQMKPIPHTEEIICADSLLLSVGLIPENELSKKAGVMLDPITGGPYVNEEMQTNIPGVFSAGNVVHIYDLVDWVTEAGYIAGRNAAKFALSEGAERHEEVRLLPGNNIHHIIPHFLSKESLSYGPQRLQMRVIEPIEGKVWVEVTDGKNLVVRKIERYVRPGEMVTVELPQKAYDVVFKARSLTVNIVKFG